MSIVIRKYESKDQEKVLELFRLNTPKYFDDSEEKDLIHYLKNEIEDYFVIALENEIVGCGGINYFYDDNIARLSWDFLNPQFQGQGFGSQIVQFRLEIISANRQINNIVVRTSQYVDKFYEKMGFELHSITKDYWAKGYDLYVMIQENKAC